MCIVLDYLVKIISVLTEHISSIDAFLFNRRSDGGGDGGGGDDNNSSNITYYY
jgi:hypothetical protein